MLVPYYVFSGGVWYVAVFPSHNVYFWEAVIDCLDCLADATSHLNNSGLN